MALKIQLSFKSTERKMYEHVIRQLSPSIYLKQLLKNELQKNDIEKKEK